MFVILVGLVLVIFKFEIIIKYCIYDIVDEIFFLFLIMIYMIIIYDKIDCFLLVVN